MTADGVVAAIRGALATVEDPELGLDIVSLGLVYGIECEAGSARVVFDPPWSPERMSDDAKFLLGVYG